MLKPLNTPIKRAGLVIMIVGLALTAITFWRITGDNYYLKGAFGDWLGAIQFKQRAFRFYWPAALGFYLAVAGLLLSYLYETTTGRLLRWIQRG